MSRSQICVILLILIAALVTVLQLCHGNAWPVIVAYWATLTLKNWFDYKDGRR